MKSDDEIDKLFKDKLENSSISDIPQAYLDDINKRLDAITPPTKKGNNFKSSGFIATVTISLAIVAFVIYSNITHKSTANKPEKDQNSSEEISTINDQKNNISENTITGLDSHQDMDENSDIENENSAGTSASSTELSNLVNDESDVTSESTHSSAANTKSDITLVSTVSASKASIKEGTKTNVNDFTNNKDTKNKTITNKENKNKSAVKTRSEMKAGGVTVVNNSKLGSNDNFSLKSANEKGKDISAEKIAHTQKSAVAKTKNVNNKAASAGKNISLADSIVVDKSLNGNVGSKTVNNKGKVADTKKSALTDAKNIDLKNDKNEELNKKNNASVADSAKLDKGQQQSLSDKKEIETSKTKTDSIAQVVGTDSLTFDKKFGSTVTSTKADSLKDKKSDSLTVAAKDSVKQAIADTTKQLPDSTKNTVKGDMSIQLLVGYSKINSTFKSMNPDYDSKRKNEESPIQAFDASLLFSYNRNKFVYTAGFNYSQWGEKINYSAITDSVNYLSGVDTTYVTQQIDSVTFVVNPVLNNVYANKGVTNSEITAHNGKNTYSYLSIPFLFGYQFGVPVFSVTPKIGGTIGIPLKSKGYYVSSDMKTLVQAKAAAWLFNCQFSLDLETKVSPYLSICVSPVYRYAITPLIHSANTTNKYNSLGVQVGAAFIIH